jgi:hypothetical protein
VAWQLKASRCQFRLRTQPRDIGDTAEASWVEDLFSKKAKLEPDRDYWHIRATLRDELLRVHRKFELSGL